MPAATWALFALLVALVHGNPSPADTAAAFLGVVLPLLAGVLAASLVVDDPALELLLAAPRAPWRTLLERLALLLAVVAASAIAYQILLVALAVDLSSLGGLTARQLVWLVPSLAVMGLGSVAGLGFGQGTMGALAVSLLWIVELLLRGQMLASPWARHLFLFTGALYPGWPYLAANWLCLLGAAAALVLAASLMLRRQERYL